MGKLKVFNEIVKRLQSNDHNATYDEILEECENDIDRAVEILRLALDRVVYDEDLEGEELAFYKQLLIRANNII